MIIIWSCRRHSSQKTETFTNHNRVLCELYFLSVHWFQGKKTAVFAQYRNYKKNVVVKVRIFIDRVFVVADDDEYPSMREHFRSFGAWETFPIFSNVKNILIIKYSITNRRSRRQIPRRNRFLIKIPSSLWFELLWFFDDTTKKYRQSHKVDFNEEFVNFSSVNSIKKVLGLKSTPENASKLPFSDISRGRVN